MTADERSAVIAASWGRFEAQRTEPRRRKVSGFSALRVDDVTRPE
jgi:hypothetical protein